jgi:hypothetical protein
VKWYRIYGASTPRPLYTVVVVEGVFYQCGFFLEYLFGSLTDWRTAAGISASIPIFTAIYIALVRYCALPLIFYNLLTPF